LSGFLHQNQARIDPEPIEAGDHGASAKVAALLQLPRHTIYGWQSRGLPRGCCRKVGKHLRFFRGPWRTAQGVLDHPRATSDSGEPANTISACCTPSRDPYEANIAPRRPRELASE
jgi:hypothetical protein